jgi:hypothetical protein
LIKGSIAKDKNKYNLYFDKYKYRATIPLPGIEWFRYGCNLTDYRKRLNYVLNSYEFQFVKDFKKLTIEQWLVNNHADMIPLIEKFIDWRSTLNSVDIKIMITSGRIHLYVNDLRVLNNIQDMIHNIEYVEPIANFERGIIYQKKPKHNIRVYFKYKKFTADETSKFIKFIEAHSFELSPSLRRIIYPNRDFNMWFWNISTPKKMKNGSNAQWLSLGENHFIDFNGDELLTLLAISYSEIIKKIYRIEKVKVE